jgi:hypothetical protein
VTPAPDRGRCIEPAGRAPAGACGDARSSPRGMTSAHPIEPRKGTAADD